MAAPDLRAASPAQSDRGKAARVDPTAVGLILVIFVTEAVIGILLLAVNPKYPEKALHERVFFTSLALSVYFAAKTVGQPLGGWLADRFEPHTVLIAGLAANLPAIALMERIKQVWFYIGAWAAFGFTLAVVWPTVYAMIGARFRPSLQGRLLALVSMGQIAGTVTGVGVGAVIVESLSYFAAFATAFALEAISLALAVIVVRGASKADRRQGLPSARVSAGGVRALRRLLTLNVVLLILLIMLVSAGVSMLTPDLGPYSERVLRLKYAEFVLLLVPPAIIAAALLVPSGYVTDRIGRNLPLTVGLAIFSGSLLLITLTDIAALASVFASCAAVGYVLCLPALSASLLDLSSEGNRGLLTGVSTAIQAIGGVVGPPIGGVLIGGYGAVGALPAFGGFGPLAPFRASAALIGATLLLALVYAGRTRHVYRDRVNADQSAAADGAES